MSEKAMYRDNLEQVAARFGDKQLIPIKDVATFLGVKADRLRESREFPAKKFEGRYYVTQVALARWLA